jgi:hypothetical protein
MPLTDLARGELDPRTPFLFFGAPVAFSFVVVIWLTKVRVRRRSTRAVHLGEVGDEGLGTPGEPAVVIPNQRAVGAAYLVITATFLGILTLLAVVIVFVLVDQPRPGPAVAGVVVAAMWVVCAAWMMRVLRGQVVLGWLALSPSGIHYCAPGHDAYVPWASARSLWLSGHAREYLIVVSAEGSSRSVFRMRAKLHRHVFELQPELAIMGDLLSIDPALAFHAIGYYLTHEEAVSELASSAGVQRIQASQVGPATDVKG